MLQDINSYLSFQLEDEIFAINVKHVLEVLQMQKITKLPKTPKFIKGVVNFRGEILPIINTRQKFNLPSIKDISKSVIIFLTFKRNEKELKVGAIVDTVLDVTSFKEIDIKDVPEMGSKYNLEFIYGMIKVKKDFIMILDVDKVFSTDELDIFTKTIQKNLEEDK